MRLLAICLSLLIYLTPSSSFAAGFAQLIGAYKADSEEKCNESVFLGKMKRDFFSDGVCIPLVSMIDPATKDFIFLALTELNDPERLPLVIKMYNEARKPVEEAFIVKIDDYDDGIFKLVDGSILKSDGGYVGYTGYHKESILFRKNAQWKICVNNRIHRVKVLEKGRSYYTRQKIYESVSESSIEEMDECD